ncbi:MAG: integrin alpha, partial [Patescibacteria group bacterium]
MKKILLLILLALPSVTFAQDIYSVSLFVEFTGEVLSDIAGTSVASAGDVNGDGYDDVIVGASQSDDGGVSNTGAVYLIYGQASTLTSASLSTVVEFTGQALATSDVAGNAIASAGDVNGDGYDDILVGATGNDGAFSNAGAVYLIYGQAAPMTSGTLLSKSVKFTGEVASDAAGNSVASAGDVNNDGYDDILIGARGNDFGG